MKEKMGQKDKVFVTGAVLFVAVLAFSMASATPGKRHDAVTDTCRTITADNVQQGYRLFKDNCKACHNRKNDQVSFLYNESKTPKAWDRVFFKRYPQCARDGSWENLHLYDQLKIHDYLYATGAGTYGPNGCG